METEPPKRYEGRVQLSDLTAEDREHVLRLLFAKINAVHGSLAGVIFHKPLTVQKWHRLGPP